MPQIPYTPLISRGPGVIPLGSFHSLGGINGMSRAVVPKDGCWSRRWNHLARLYGVAIGSCAVLLYWQIFVFASQSPIFPSMCVKLAHYYKTSQEEVKISKCGISKNCVSHHQATIFEMRGKNSREKKINTFAKNKLPGSDAEAGPACLPELDRQWGHLASCQEPPSLDGLPLGPRTLGQRIEKQINKQDSSLCQRVESP